MVAFPYAVTETWSSFGPITDRCVVWVAGGDEVGVTSNTSK